MNNYDLTVLVLTYNSNLRKLKQTLCSILFQENIKLQIVLSDDGSKEDKFDAIEDLFKKYNFTEYVLIKNHKNVGTVKNMAGSLKFCKGKYIKGISAGDYLNGKNILREWFNYMEKTKVVLSVSDAIYYRLDNEKEIPVITRTHPQNNIMDKNLKRNYLIYDDLFLGAAVMWERETVCKYINMIVGRVKYAEDYMCRIMIYNDEQIGFFNKETVIYETGSGISTNGSSKWNKLLKKDWNEANKILLSIKSNDLDFRNELKKLINIYRHTEGKNLIYKLFMYLRIKGLITYKVKLRLKPRLSSKELPYKWLEELKEE